MNTSKINSKSIDDAIENNNVKLVEQLIEAGHKVPKSGLWILARNIRGPLTKLNTVMPMIELLRSNGAMVQLPESQSQPISQAIMNGNLEFVRYLLENGVEPNLGRPISQAAMANQEEIISLLLEFGAKPTNTSLIESVEKYNVNSVKMLLEAGANPNINYNPPLHLIVNSLNSYNATHNTLQIEEIIRLLLQYGADPTLLFTNGNLKGTALDIIKVVIEKDNPQYLCTYLKKRMGELLELHTDTWWQPFDIQRSLPLLQMCDFKFVRRRQYGVCCAVLLCGDRLDRMMDLGGEGMLPALPNELLLYILQFLRTRELGRNNNTTVYDPLKALPALPKVEELKNNNSPPNPFAENIAISNQNPFLKNNSKTPEDIQTFNEVPLVQNRHLRANSLGENLVVSPPRNNPELTLPAVAENPQLPAVAEAVPVEAVPETNSSSNNFVKVSPTSNNNFVMVTRNNLKGGTKKIKKMKVNTHDRAVIKLANRMLNSEKIDVEKEFGISEVEFEHFIYAFIYMTPEGLFNNEICKNMMKKFHQKIKKEEKQNKKQDKKVRSKSAKKNSLIKTKNMLKTTKNMFGSRRNAMTKKYSNLYRHSTVV